MRCVRCYSYAINHAQHGRDGSDGDLCDVCYWRARAEYPAAAARVPLTRSQRLAVFSDAQAAMEADQNASWREEIVIATERAHGITGGAA